VSINAADQMVNMKKQGMAEAAEQLLAATLAARVDANAASGARVHPVPAGGCCYGGEGYRGLLRRRRVDHRAGIACAVPALL
jgi:hypothetical protein